MSISDVSSTSDSPSNGVNNEPGFESECNTKAKTVEWNNQSELSMRQKLSSFGSEKLVESVKPDNKTESLNQSSNTSTVDESTKESLENDSAASNAHVSQADSANPVSGPFPAPEVKVKVFVGRIPRDTTEKDLHDLFIPYGVVEEIVIMQDKVTKQPKGSAFVKMTSICYADEAILALNNTKPSEMFTNPLQVKYAQGELERLGLPQIYENVSEKVKLFVCRVPKNMNEQTLKSYFDPYGTVEEIMLMKNTTSGESKGCGFVKYAYKEQSLYAIQQLNEKLTLENQSKPLEVRVAESRRRGDRVAAPSCMRPGETRTGVVGMDRHGSVSGYQNGAYNSGVWSPNQSGGIPWNHPSGGSWSGAGWMPNGGMWNSWNAPPMGSSSVSSVSSGGPGSAGGVQMNSTISSNQSASMNYPQGEVSRHQQDASGSAAASSGAAKNAHGWTLVSTPDHPPYWYNSLTGESQWYPGNYGSSSQQQGWNSSGGASGLMRTQQQQHMSGAVGSNSSGGSSSTSGRNLFVFHVPNEWSAKDMEGTFGLYGPVSSCRIATDKSTGRNRGYAFVTYENHESANLAIKNLNGLFVHGKRLKVSLKRGDEGTGSGVGDSHSNWVGPYGSNPGSG